LVSLLADDDPAIYREVRKIIISYGPEASEWLREPALSNDRLLRCRAQEIRDHFGRKKADTDFLAFCLNRGEDFELEEGALLLAQTQFPEINSGGYRALLDDFATELRERLDLNGPPEQILRVINEYLFYELKFSGNEQTIEPENSYLNCVLDRRTGNPISLCVLYLLVGRRLRLPITGIGLPGHFVCRYQTSRAEIYIDAFGRGRLLTKADCIKYLMQIQHRLDDGALAPLSSRRMLMRICANLHQIYTQLKSAPEMERLQRYLIALAK